MRFLGAENFSLMRRSQILRPVDPFVDSLELDRSAIEVVSSTPRHEMNVQVQEALL